MTKWKLAPVEPTPEMIDAWNNDDSDEFRHAYHVMLEAAPQPFEVRHIPILADECRRVWNIVSTFQEAVSQAEKAVIKRVLRNDEDANVVIEEIGAALMKAATEEVTQANAYLQRWGEDEIDRFAKRKPSLASDRRWLEG